MERKVDVLGVEYTILQKTDEEDALLKEADGCCDTSVKRITLRRYTQEDREQPNSQRDLDEYQRKALRHEIVHAFLYESGLSVNSGGASNWAGNEEMVDWIAIQGPKIMKAWQEAGAV